MNIRRVGEMAGTCRHGKAVLSSPCRECEKEEPIDVFSPDRSREKMPPDGISQLGDALVQAFHKLDNGVKGRFPVWVGTKEELRRGLVRMELQRSWRDGYSGGSPERLEIRMTVKPAFSWWRRFLNLFSGGARAHLAPHHGSNV